MEINKSIFRTYDIRGVVPDALNPDVANLIGKGFATIMKNKGEETIIVGHDIRLTSESLNKSLIEGIVSTGMNVIDIGLCATPMTYFAREHLNIKPSIMITASHNPKEYNGFKICGLGKDTIFGDEIQELRKFIEKGEFAVSSVKGRVEEKNINSVYIDEIFGKVKLGNKKLKVAIDYGNGSASIFADDFSKKLGLEIYSVCNIPDGNFPNHHPDPSQEKYMLDFEKFIVDNGCDIGISFDGDADRVIVFDENGRILFGDEYAIIIWRDLLPKNFGAKVLLDVKCSQSLYEEAKRLGGVPEFCKVGSPLIKNEIRKQNLLFSAEYAGHVYFNDEHYGYDDAIYGAMRILKILSETDKKMSELSKDAMKYHGTPEVLVRVTDDNKFKIVNEVRDEYLNRGLEVITVDGARIIFSDGWGLIRASNTGPNLTVKAEATSIERAEEILSEIKNYVEEYSK